MRHQIAAIIARWSTLRSHHCFRAEFRTKAQQVDLALRVPLCERCLGDVHGGSLHDRFSNRKRSKHTWNRTASSARVSRPPFRLLICVFLLSRERNIVTGSTYWAARYRLLIGCSRPDDVSRVLFFRHSTSSSSYRLSLSETSSRCDISIFVGTVQPAVTISRRPVSQTAKKKCGSSWRGRSVFVLKPSFCLSACGGV